MRGDLRQSSLAVLIRHLYAERKSGVLHVSRQNIRKRLHFNKGILSFADDGEASPAPSTEQAESLLYSLFTWTSGEFTFEEGVPTVDDKVAFSEPPAELILEGNRSIDDSEILERLLGTEESVFACATTTELPLFKTRLAPAESAVLSFAREQPRFRRGQIPRVTSEGAVLRALNSLVAVGLIDIVEKGAPAPEPVPVVEAEVAPEVASEPPREVEQLLNNYEAKRAGTETPAPQPEATAPAPPQPEPPSEPSEVEQLLNTYEAKRAGVEAPPTPPPQAAPLAPEPEPFATVAEATPPESPVDPPPPEAATYEPPVVDAPPPEEPRTAPPPGPLAPPSPTAGAPAKPKVPWTSLIADAIPPGKGRLVGGAAIGLVAAIALVVWLTSGGDDPTEAEVVAAASPEQIEPTPDPEPEPTQQAQAAPATGSAETVPTEAELFYQANVAYERGDYEMSKAALTMLLERQPDFGAALELLGKVELMLTPLPEPAPTTTTTSARPRQREQTQPQPRTAVEATPTTTTRPDPAKIMREARAALTRGDFDSTRAKLDELHEIDPTYPGVSALRSELSDKLWLQKLPLVFTARHDHSLGGCDGVLTLTNGGVGYRSDDHVWFWSFQNLARTDRVSAKHVRLTTQDDKNYKFDLREPLSGVDWTKYLELAR